MSERPVTLTSVFLGKSPGGSYRRPWSAQMEIKSSLDVQQGMSSYTARVKGGQTPTSQLDVYYAKLI